MLPEPFTVRDDHIAISLPGAEVVFTTRHGGVSSGPYASLNLGRMTDDDPAAVEANRVSLERGLGVGFAYGRQVHGGEVAVASAATARPASVDQLVAVDGWATSVSGVAPMVLTADCLPVAVAGDGAVAMLHAGWRGLAGGVLEAGVALVRALAHGGGPLSAAVGPGAGVCCYQAGPEVHERFAGIEGASDGDRVDLAAVARELLAHAGVETIHDCGLCTICTDGAPFFSHRRDRGVTGRQAGIAWLSG